MLKKLPNTGSLRAAFFLAFAFLLSGGLFAQLTVSVSGENIVCFGLSSGTATATPTGGASPYSYAWSNGGASRTITNLNAGTYGVTVTDANGQVANSSITLTQPTRVQAIITDPEECQAPYVIAAEPSGGTGPYTYNWSTGADTRAVIVPAGDYCVTVVDAALCGLVVCKTIEDNPPGVSLVDVDVTCRGANDGAITANPSGGVAPYTYAWSNGATGRTVTGLAPGNYQVTLTDARGCTAMASIGITQPTAITGQIVGDATVCPGVTNAVIRIVPNGGTPPYSYLWSPGGFTSQAIGGQGAGTYTVTVTDVNGCTLVDDFVVTESETPEISITGNLLLCGEGTTGTLRATPASGPVSQFTYEWSTGATSPTITGVGPGNYSVTATDVNGCEGTATATVRLIDLDLTLTSTSVSCANGNDGTATALATGGDQPYSYQWSNGGNTAQITGLTPGVYGVTVTEENGCKVSGNVQVGEPNELVISATPTNITCAGDNDGLIDVTVTGGTPGYTYRWNDGAVSQDRNNLTAGNYGLTVTDANGCTDNITVQITSPATINLSGVVTDLSCNGDGSGRIVVTAAGGTPAYRYAWSNGGTTRTLSGLSAGTYTVTVTDANACTLVASYTVSQPTALVVSGTVTNIDCFGGNGGSIDLTVAGGTPTYSYAWSNGATTPDLNNLNAGNFIVTVTDANECARTATFTITEPADLRINAIPTNVNCSGDNNGRIAITASGGTPAYTYRWSDGSTSEDRDNLSAATYRLTVTDANGCTETATVQITAPPAIVVTGNVTHIACNGDLTGAITVTASGGTPAYRYAWNTGATTRTISGLMRGTYTVTVTDANNCTDISSYIVNQATGIMVSGNVTSLDCFGDGNGAIDLTVSGGTPGYRYLWNNGATTQDLTNVAAGTYTVTVTDANQCTETETFTISQPANFTLAATPTNIRCNGENTGAIDLMVDGGVQPYRYLWSNGATTEDLSGLTAGTYSSTVTDANGCTKTISVSISQPRGLNGFAQLTPVACSGEATGAINLTVEFGTPAYTYAWSNGATTQDLSGLTAGNYTVTVTDANDCTLVQIYNVGSVNPINLTGVVDPATCNGSSTGSINLTVTGGTGGYAYGWSNGATTRDISGLAAGNYTVTVSDANECSAVATFTVTQPDQIDLTVTAPDIVCGGTASGTVTVFPRGGTAPYTYRWSNGDTDNMLDNVSAGSYTVTVTDANGCTDVTSGIVLDELPQLSCSVRVDQQSTNGSNGQLTVVVDGGTVPYTYLWSNNETTATISGLPGGTYSVTVTDANNCTTECSATLRLLSGIGDFVWVDTNLNGQQDPGEPGLADYPVSLKNAAGVIIATTTTDENGFYAFMGLEPGTYSVLFIEPEGGDRTLFNVGNDATDNDADPAMDGMTQQYTLAPGEFNMTVDAGFIVGIDGPIIDPCNCLDNNTNPFNGQFSEAVEITAGPGQVWTVIAQQNAYQLESQDGTTPPDNPELVPLGTVLALLGEATPDPVFGRRVRYGFDFRIIDSLQYSVTISNGVQQFTVENQCFYPEVRFSELPPEELCRFDAAFMLEGFGIYRGNNLPGDAIFTLNGQVVTEIDPMTLPAGEYVIEVQFIANPAIDENGLEYCMPMRRRQFVLIDDCPAKLGDFVWQDSNGNGQQDPGEPGIEGVKVTVTSQDGTYMDMTFTDETGMYMFSVDPGTYKMTFERPEDFRATTQNSGNDATDSDMNPTTLMTGFYTVGPDGQDFTIDAGFINPCVSNVTNPGTIGFNQEVCGPGNAPEPFVELAPATGGEGDIEYLWMFNTSDPNLNIVFWQALPNSNTPNYAAGPVSQTTYFVRCVRRNGCRYIESNTITVEVGDDAVADISGPNVICQDEEAVFQVVNPGNGAQISWTFTGPSSVQSSNQSIVRTTFGSFGTFSVTLTVTANGCTSTRTQSITVINRPSRCGGNLTANGSVNNLQQRDVRIEWEVPADGSDYAFQLERSINGVDFVNVAGVDVPAFVSANGMAMYRQGDISPLAGRNFYRVRMLDATYGDMLSNVVELQLAGASTALGRVFPNPARNGMLHVEMTDIATQPGEMSVQLFDVRGNQVVAPTFLETGAGVINLPTLSQPAGVYFLRIVAGDRTETHRVIVD